MTMNNISANHILVLKPLLHSDDCNIVRISRVETIDETNVLHIAGGEHTGIIVNRLSNEKPNMDCDVELNSTVWLFDGVSRKQENRSFRFRFYGTVEQAEKHQVAQQYFKDLISLFPRDYATLLKHILKQLQHGYDLIEEIEIDFRLADHNKQYQIADMKDYDIADSESEVEIEDVSVGHIREVLERAYPNGLSVNVIAESLRCTEDDVLNYLSELEKNGIAQRLQNEWIRIVDNSKMPPRIADRACPPTVAIITCLFTEKQCIDSVIDDCNTLHGYRSGGDSNVYSIGWVGKHRVVATKLAVIGDSREAITSVGSITTRLLGNFQDVEHVLIVGVGGGVAHYTDAKLHVRLGDVVVSAPNSDAYVHAHSYLLDRKTQNVNGFATRKWNPINNVLSNIARRIDQQMLEEWKDLTYSSIKQLNAANPDSNFSRPSIEADSLALRVGNDQVVMIPPSSQQRNDSVVHVGPIGSMTSYKVKNSVGDDVQNGQSGNKDTMAGLRRRFAAENRLLAMDVGFDAVVEAVVGSRIESWGLIRGIADYQHGQSRIGRLWQNYTSVRAATLASCIIKRIEVQQSLNGSA